jgi:hypothetical protein
MFGMDATHDYVEERGNQLTEKAEVQKKEMMGEKNIH